MHNKKNKKENPAVLYEQAGLLYERLPHSDSTGKSVQFSFLNA